MTEPSTQSGTGLTLMLFDQAGNAQASVDWQDAADRIVALLSDGTANDAWSYARAHRIIDAMWGDRDA